MKDLGLAINLTNNIKQFQIGTGNLPILDFFKNNYRSIRNSLKNKEIIFLEQLVYSESLCIKQRDKLLKTFRGKLPNWWKDIQEFVTENNSLKIKKEYINKMNLTEIEKSNINIIPATTIDRRKNNWIIGLIGDTNIAYGKICSKKQEQNQNNRLKCIHFDNATTSKGKLHLKKCTKIKCNIRM